MYKEVSMKVVILAGGFGTRISEESHLRPKPMIEIGERPILWHIMKHYSCYGYNEFVICGGYKQNVIKAFFADYFLNTADVTFDLSDNSMRVLNNHSEPWKVTIVDTGLATMTGGRVKRVQKFIDNETFMLTYGDAVSNVDIKQLIEFHKSHGKMTTLTAIQPGGRFGKLDIDKAKTVTNFKEKKVEDGGWVSGGYMVLQPEIFDLIEGDQTTFEKEPLELAAASGNLKAYYHKGFWQCMDTMSEKLMLENLWNTGKAPWKLWES
jgi:glucose-1-phosphate cytidylyltransferase